MHFQSAFLDVSLKCDRAWVQRGKNKNTTYKTYNQRAKINAKSNKLSPLAIEYQSTPKKESFKNALVVTEVENMSGGRIARVGSGFESGFKR